MDLKRDVSIVLAGAAGQGIETVEGFMATVLKLSGYCVFVTREFMSRIRGGTNSIQLRVSTEPVGAFTRRTDIMVPLTKTAIPHLRQYSRLGDETLYIGEEEILSEEGIDDARKVEVPLNSIAEGIGGRIYSNTVAAGVITALFGVKEEVAAEYLERRFGSKGEKIVKQNIEAWRAGKEIGKGVLESGAFEFDLERNPTVEQRLLMSGTDGVALGAIAGGCNFISSYPMSPSTGVLVFLSQRSQKFGIVVDQAEDEIAAINKGLGAWYAGGRAMVTTSGGGFALMTEGLSLAGMLENPMVIHLAQRPGPATGLPTRTEQGDLQHALYAGHGEFPRIILTPRTPEDAFYLTQRAFNLADRFQVPVFVLTDQFLVDSSFTSERPDLSQVQIERHIVETGPDYKRYRIMEDGVSPRGIPGYGEGLVGVDSDEHDEDGHITENLNLRPRMVEKRLHRKLEIMRKESIPPTLYGSEDYKTLALAWGSNYYVVKEAVDTLGREDLVMLFFKQVYPLSPSTMGYLDRAEEVAIVENNATCQFGRVIQLETGLRIPEANRLLKYDGLPFPVDPVSEFLGGVGG
jgi:2-oxoglutarate ferredoxin oxidoreductase subunit alpha